MFFLSSLSREYKESELIIFFVCIILVFLSCLFIKKIFFKNVLKQEFYIFPVLNVRSITNIAMIIAMNSALIFVIAWLSKGVFGAMFQMYPGARMLIESTLIKIGGIIFGPVIGIFIGAATDILTVMLTSSIIHYGYWFMAILNGFMGGLIHMILKCKKDDKKFKSNYLCVVLVVATSLFFWHFLGCNLSGDSAVVNLLSKQVEVNKNFIISLVSTIGAGVVAFLSLGFLSNILIKEHGYKNNRIIKFFHKNNLPFQIFAVIFVSYVMLDLITLPVFDIVISSLPYEQFLIMRLTSMIPHLIISFWIIWSIYKLYNNIKPHGEEKFSEGLKIKEQMLQKESYSQLLH